MSVRLNEKWNWVKTDSPDFSEALELILNSNKNLFIFGPGGVGKSILLQIAADKFPNALVMGPTGISAANLVANGVKATTIHSTLKIPPVPVFDSSVMFSQDAMRIASKTNLVLIDEASMINASLMDFILRLFMTAKEKAPRIILFGDLFQLPPVIDGNDKTVETYFKKKYQGKHFFFNSMYYKALNFEVLHLNEVYRQTNPEFKTALNNLRLGIPEQKDLDLFNTRVINSQEFISNHEFMMYLASTNRVVKQLNDEYSNRPEFQAKIHYRAIVDGDYDLNRNKMIDREVSISVGQQVMCTFNNTKEGYQNGTIGKVTAIYPNRVVIKNAKNQYINVLRETWRNYKVETNPKTGNLEYKVTGSCEQIACKPAFAVTFHKSQGLTLENVYIDLNSYFIPDAGIYLALSRCTTLEGIGLSRSIIEDDIKINVEALEYFAEYGLKE